jgi:dTDP-4-dehydrorhamnose 3,5-epimerase
MNFIPLKLGGVFLIKPKILKDNRGFFFEKYIKDKLDLYLGYKLKFLQENQSLSNSGVFRGLHLQVKPYEQAKLVTVNRGKILDIVVDIRKESPTFGRHIKVILDAKNNYSLFVPRGFAHGFLTIDENSVVNYKVDNLYSRKHERNLSLYDKDLKIKLSMHKKKIILSEKDANGLRLKELFRKQ